MRWIKILLISVSVLVAVVAIAAVLLNRDSEPSVDPAWGVKETAQKSSTAVTVRFTGTSTLLFSDGETHWMVDGWFSRPGPLDLAFGEIEPDLDAITTGLANNHVTTLRAVIPVHSHYDHAMDAPEVALRTQATLMGSESTANIGRGWGLKETQIFVFENRQPVSVGKFSITPIETKHFQFPDPATRQMALANPTIEQPLVPPVNAFDYRLGKAYALHVKHPKGSFMIVGSAGYIEGGLKGFDAEVIFLGIGGLGGQTKGYRETYWRETVATVKPKRVIPIHYDGLTAPIEGPFKGPSLVFSLLSGGEENTLPFLKAKQAANPQLVFQILPRYDEVVLFP